MKSGPNSAADMIAPPSAPITRFFRLFSMGFSFLIKFQRAFSACLGTRLRAGAQLGKQKIQQVSSRSAAGQPVSSRSAAGQQVSTRSAAGQHPVSTRSAAGQQRQHAQTPYFYGSNHAATQNFIAPHRSIDHSAVRRQRFSAPL